MKLLLQVHIIAGSLAMLLGAAALLAQKGGTAHRRSGRLFVYSMLVMGLTAAALGDIGGGLMATYFVATGLTTVRSVTGARWLNTGALVVAVMLAFGSMDKGVTAFASPGGVLDGVPFFMLFFIGTVMAFAAAGDVRVMWSGALRGRPRLSRHVWRMCFGLFIAAGSFFSIEARVARILPEPFTTSVMRALPVASIFVGMFYWLCRLRSRQVRSIATPVLVKETT